MKHLKLFSINEEFEWKKILLSKHEFDEQDIQDVLYEMKDIGYNCKIERNFSNLNFDTPRKKTDCLNGIHYCSYEISISPRIKSRPSDPELYINYIREITDAITTVVGRLKSMYKIKILDYGNEWRIYCVDTNSPMDVTGISLKSKDGTKLYASISYYEEKLLQQSKILSCQRIDNSSLRIKPKWQKYDIERLREILNKVFYEAIKHDYLRIMTDGDFLILKIGKN